MSAGHDNQTLAGRGLHEQEVGALFNGGLVVKAIKIHFWIRLFGKVARTKHIPQVAERINQTVGNEHTYAESALLEASE